MIEIWKPNNIALIFGFNYHSRHDHLQVLLQFLRRCLMTRYPLSVSHFRVTSQEWIPCPCRGPGPPAQAPPPATRASGWRQVSSLSLLLSWEWHRVKNGEDHTSNRPLLSQAAHEWHKGSINSVLGQSYYCAEICQVGWRWLRYWRSGLFDCITRAYFDK